MHRTEKNSVAAILVALEQMVWDNEATRAAEAESQRASAVERLRKKRIRQGNVGDLVRHLEREGKARDGAVDYSAVDPETRMAFYQRRRTNNSSATLFEVMGAERWTLVHTRKGGSIVN